MDHKTADTISHIAAVGSLAGSGVALASVAFESLPFAAIAAVVSVFAFGLKRWQLAREAHPQHRGRRATLAE